MHRPRTALAAAALALALGLSGALAVATPAAAATCKGQVTFGANAGTMYNSSSTPDKCERVQIRLIVYLGAGYSLTKDGPQVSTGSFVDYVGGTSYSWYGHARPGSTWAGYKNWPISGLWESFSA